METKSADLSTLSDRLNYALKMLGIKKADLARLIRVKPQVIQFLCNSKTQSSRFTFQIAAVLGINFKWLAIGEGSMSIEDDMIDTSLKGFISLPVLNKENLKQMFLFNKKLDYATVNTWIPLKTNSPSAFAITMEDASMEPLFPLGSSLFVNPICTRDIKNSKYIFIYHKNFDTFMIREVFSKESSLILIPKNLELFNSMELSENILIIGIVTDFLWHIGD